jgi:biopolymer transport protein ExbB
MEWSPIMTKFRILALAALMLTMGVALATPAHAEGGLFSSIISDGGPIGMIIIVLSVATLAMIIEFGVNVRRDKICPPELVDEIEALLEEEEYQEALELCESEPNFLTSCLAAGLPRLNEGYQKMQEAMEAQAGIEAVKLQQKVSWMLFLSNVAPMLGLFGTVSGMIQAFKKIQELGDKVTPKDLATGISAALVTTFLGLLVAIPALAAYQIFRNKATRISIDFAGILEDMTERFRNR